MTRDILPEDLENIENPVIVDIRSPEEFKNFHIPGAINVPLFDDEQKKLIGKVYREEGVDKALKVGEEIGKSRLKEILDAFLELKGSYKNIVVYCWRGGMRSQSLCQALTELGVETLRLKGGYRTYRRYILKRTEEIIDQKQLIVLSGKTGCGKTHIIRHLKKEGFPVLDLEGHANHRGSLLGGTGLGEQPSQKMFESLLYEDLKSIKSTTLIVEDESRRIGRVHIPQPLWKKKMEGRYVEIRLPIEERVRVILEDYTSREGWEKEVRKAIERLRKYLGNKKYRDVLELLERGDYREVVRFLIEEHYDKRYRVFKEPELVIEYRSVIEAVSGAREVLLEMMDEGEVQDSGLQRGKKTIKV